MARTDELPRFRVAAVQAAPAFLDRERTVDLVETWTDRAAQQGARVVAFSRVVRAGVSRVEPRPGTGRPAWAV